MKALILKDLYAILGSMKQLVFILLLLAAAMVPSTGAAGYIMSATLIISMMVVTTCSFDEACRFSRTALLMPLRRRDIVTGKYVLLLLCSLTGAAAGMVLGLICSLVMKAPIDLVQTTLMAVLAVSLCNVVLGTALPLIFRYGTEKGRILIFLAALLPAGLVTGIIAPLKLLGVAITDRMIVGAIAASPFIALVWNTAAHHICCRIFEKQDV